MQMVLMIWFLGDSLLIIAPLMKRGWPYVVQQLNCLAAGMIALAPIGAWEDVTLRFVAATVVLLSMVKLGQIKKSEVIPCLVPYYWRRIWQGKLGSAASMMVGTEVMCWGGSFLRHFHFAWLGRTYSGQSVVVPLELAGHEEG
jgi:hypothetical protein